MAQYNVLVQAKLIDNIQANLSKKKYTIQVQMGDKLTKSLGQIDNQLERLKIKNRDAFANSPAVQKELQNVMQLYEAFKKTGIGYDELKLGIGRVSNEVEKYNEHIRITSSRTDNLGTSMQKALLKITQWGIATSLVYGSLRQIREGTQYISDLNEQMTNIGLVTGQTTEQMQGMASQFNSIAKDLGSSTLDVAKGATEFIRQGRSMSETMDLLSTSTKLSKLGNLESADATSKLTAVLLGYNLQAKEAIKVTDVLVALDNSFASSTEEIVSGMEKASSMAKQAGVSYSDLASYITVVQAKTQQSGDTVGQAFKTIFARMEQVKAGADLFTDATTGETEAINNVEKVLLKEGIALRDNNLQFRDMSDVLADVAKKYQELGAQGRDVEQAQILGAIAGKY